jgi:hypothetical protein
MSLNNDSNCLSNFQRRKFEVKTELMYNQTWSKVAGLIIALSNKQVKVSISINSCRNYGVLS